MNESYVFPEIQILLEGLGKMQTLNEVTPVINFITCVDLYSLNRISRGGQGRGGVLLFIVIINLFVNNEGFGSYFWGKNVRNYVKGF